MRLHRTLPWRQVRRYSASRELSQLPKGGRPRLRRRGGFRPRPEWTLNGRPSGERRLGWVEMTSVTVLAKGG